MEGEGREGEGRGGEGRVILFCIPPGLTEDQCHLQSIGLGGNDIQDEGAVLLATALKSNTHLQCLGLGGNQICELPHCALLGERTTRVPVDHYRHPVL